MAVVNLEELLEHVKLSTDDLNTKCHEQDLGDLSLLIPSWEAVSPFLNLKDADIEDIRSEGKENRMKVLNMLKKWKKRHGFRATFRVLVDVFLLKLEDANMAEEVCKQLKKRNNFELLTSRAQVRAEEQSAVDAYSSTPSAMREHVLRSGRTLPGKFPERSKSPEVESSEEESGVEVGAVSDVDLESDEASTASSEADFRAPSRIWPKRRRRSGCSCRSSESVMSDQQDEEEEEVSRSGDKRGAKKRNGGKREANSNGSSNVARDPSVVLDYSEYVPPEWIRHTKLHLSSNFPQVGDVVVYCHQGHRLYVEAVKKERLYPIRKAKMPWEKYKLQPQEFCQVTNVRYVVGPPTLCSITLALVSPLPQSKAEDEEGGSSLRSRDKERVTFSFKYHDIEGVAVFLVLDSLYKTSVYTQWHEGDRFRSHINEEFWFGTVREKKAFSEEHPNSFWHCYSVLWDDEKVDLLSPWDMEPILAPVEGEEDDSSPQISSGITELLESQEQAVAEAWGGEGEPARILHGLEMVCELDEAYMFIHPVDLEQIPSYCTCVAFPTDLSTITERMRNKLYRSPDIVDPSDCYTPEPEGEVGMSLSEGGHKGPPRSDLPAAEAVIPTTPVKQQSLKLEDTDMAEEVCKQLTKRNNLTCRAQVRAEEQGEPCSVVEATSGIEVGRGDVALESDETSTASSEAGNNFRTPSRKRPKRRRRRLSESVMSYQQDEEEEEVSRSGDKRGAKKRNGGKREANSNGSSKVARDPSVVLDYSKYAPPEWIRQTKLHLSPYLPQVGDLVVYCHQGHRLYVEAVKKERLYPIRKAKMPWEKYKLQPQEFCQVTNVRYLVGPPTLCSITLALVSPLPQSEAEDEEGGSSLRNRDKERVTFSFKYHDIDGVADFLVLDSLYKTSVYTQWQEGDEFCSHIKKKFWFGTVKKKWAFSEEHPNSFWQCYSVLWDDEGVDQLSPWDMEPVEGNDSSPQISSRITELLESQEEAVAEAWGGEGEPARILHGLEMVCELDEAYMFIHPVDVEQIPSYCTCVAFPTDLSTITERMRNKLYRRKRALLWELSQMAKNAVAFNEEDSLIVKHAKVLVQTLWKFIDSPNIVDPREPEWGVKEVNVSLSEAVVFVDTSDLPAAEAVIPTTPWWVMRAKDLLNAVSNHDNSYPFMKPVDTATHRYYLDYVVQPMDLSMVTKRLVLGHYITLFDFVNDMKLIFHNSYRYNEQGSEMYKSTKVLENFFDDKVSFLKGTIDRSLRSRSNINQEQAVSDEGEGSDVDEESLSAGMSSCNESVVVSQRQTRSSHKAQLLSLSSSESTCVDEVDDSMMLHTRAAKHQRGQPPDTDNSDSEEERDSGSSESVLSDQQDEEEEEVSRSGDEEGAKKGNGGKRKADSNGSSKEARKASVVLDYSEYAPPEWIRQTKLHLSPYFPQVGDVVVYCHQGHRLYVEAVKKERLYPIHKAKMPWEKYNLQPQEFCQVTNVRYVVGPPTLCSITLALVSPLPQSEAEDEEGARSRDKERVTFSFKYHDIDSVADFLVLDSLYKTSVYTQWQEGDKFRSHIKKKFWFGTVKKKWAFSEEHPNSFWQCYSVLWDDEGVDQLSPWDMEPMEGDDSSPQISSRITELLESQEEAVAEAWGGEGEPARILHGLEMVCELDEAYMFIHPVDLEQIPSYCTCVAFPTDLSTITERMRNKLYRRKRALLWEMSQMAKNAVAVNEEGSLIVKHVNVLVQTLWKFIDHPDIVDPCDCYAPEPEGEVGVSLSEVVVFVDTSGLPAAEAVIPTTPSWVMRAKDLLNAVSGHDNSYPFMKPVDTATHRYYLDYVEQPMDLSVVGKRLVLGHYITLSDFVIDMKLIFQNSYCYNEQGSEMYKITKVLENFFDDKVSSINKSLRSRSNSNQEQAVFDEGEGSDVDEDAGMSSCNESVVVSQRQTGSSRKAQLLSLSSSKSTCMYEVGHSMRLHTRAVQHQRGQGWRKRGPPDTDNSDRKEEEKEEEESEEESDSGEEYVGTRRQRGRGKRGRKGRGRGEQ